MKFWALFVWFLEAQCESLSAVCHAASIQQGHGSFSLPKKPQNISLLLFTLHKQHLQQPLHLLFPGKSLGQAAPPSMPIISQSETKNPRINQLSARWQQVWLLALERQRKLNDALDRLEEVTTPGQELGFHPQRGARSIF